VDLCCEILEEEGVPIPGWYNGTINSEIVLHTWETSLNNWVDEINRRKRNGLTSPRPFFRNS
jgi:hypothetical protein